MAELNNAVERVLQGAVSKVLSKMMKNEASSEEEFEPSFPKKLNKNKNAKYFLHGEYLCTYTISLRVTVLILKLQVF